MGKKGGCDRYGRRLWYDLRRWKALFADLQTPIGDGRGQEADEPNIGRCPATAVQVARLRRTFIMPALRARRTKRQTGDAGSWSFLFNERGIYLMPACLPLPASLLDLDSNNAFSG
jgi:hypothetical protein